MATKPTSVSRELRINRRFSEDFKRNKVQELDKKLITIGELCKEYQVSSTSVYKWIYKYSFMKKKAVKMVVESESDTARILALRKHIADLERLLGSKQFEIDFMQKQLEIAKDQFGVDLKKKPFGPPSAGSSTSGESTLIR